jgi:hypothetical protein
MRSHNGYDLVPCPGCRGRVRLKVARADEPPTPGPARAGMTTIETVYWQQRDGQPLAVLSRFSRPSHADRDPYARPVLVGTAWQPLDLGWLAGQAVGLLLVANRETATDRAVEIGFGDAPAVALLVLPGESCRLQPADAAAVRLRCSAGEARCEITLFPL